MTPENAAAILAVSREASAREVEQAFRRAARRLHPDHAPGKASDDFINIVHARDALLATMLVATPRSSAPIPVMRLQRISRTLFATWAALLALGILVSIAGSSLPLTVFDPLLRFSALAAGTVGFALTGRKGFFVLALVAVAATAISTVVATTLGGLLGMLLLAAPVYGLLSAGLSRHRAGLRSRLA
jgi:hypothetical protein